MRAAAALTVAGALTVGLAAPGAAQTVNTVNAANNSNTGTNSTANNTANTAMNPGEQGSSKSEPAPAAKLELNGLSSRANIEIPQLPDIKVPADVVEGAKKIGINLPERISLGSFGRAAETAQQAQAAPSAEVAVQTPPVVAATTEQRLREASERQLVAEGHTRDEQAQAIANQWATQAALGEATFTGDIGKGTVGTELGDGQIYRLNEADAANRLMRLNEDKVVGSVEVTPVKKPQRFGVATSRDGNTIYLVEYFLK